MSSVLTTAGTFLNGSLDPVPEPEDVNPGWIALVVVVALVAVTVLLWLNMRKQLRKVHVEDSDETQQAADGPDAGTADGSGGPDRA